jgi:hypothetical protein
MQHRIAMQNERQVIKPWKKSNKKEIIAWIGLISTVIYKNY